ncbi:MAG: DUF975 family protein [Clostridia bacterium]|nr:DUF975 family protein [Clostridia bacterium]
MYNRAGIKEWAKRRLAENRWLLVLVTFLGGLLGALEGGGTSFNFNTDTQVELPVDGLAPVLMVAVVVMLLFAIGYGVFVGNVVHVGYHGWMLRYARGEQPPVGEMFASFRIYLPAMKTMLLHDVYIFLWTLLFIIPGIVKTYAYSMTRYIIYENPNLTPDQAITLSRKMTDGYKGELFVLGLSFVGWNLLSGLTLGLLGVLYVNPYMYLTQAGTYEWLKHNALQSGRVTWADFGGTMPVWPEQPPVQEEG